MDQCKTRAITASTLVLHSADSGVPIAQKFGVRLGVTAVGRLLAELDSKPQKPFDAPTSAIPWRSSGGRRRCSRACAPAPGASARTSSSSMRLAFAPITCSADLGSAGQTPEVPTSGRRQSVSAISAVNARGAFWYETYTERLNAGRFVERLRHFMRRSAAPRFPVRHSHPTHTAKLVAQYVQRLTGRLELHFLPGYAPELNPDEFVWNHLKRQGVSKTPLQRDECLRSRVESDLAAIQSRPALVRSFFHAPSVAYTRD